MPLPLKDPKDISGYLNGHTDDNLPTSPGGTVTLSAVSDADGIVRAILEVDPQYAGNNYEVEASFKPPSNFDKAARSPAYTSWRRLYIEHDRMYKEGSFLTQTSGAGQPNPARVFVQSSGVFSVGDEVHILSGESIPHSEGQIGQVAAVEPVPGCSCVDLEVPLTLTYLGPQQPEPFPWPYGFLARRAGGFFDAQPDTTKMKTAFEDGFTSWHLPAGSEGFIPYWESAVGNNLAERRDFVRARSPLFFKNYDRNESDQKPFVNHVQLISAAKLEQAPGSPDFTLGLAQGNNSGITVASNWSWVFNGAIALYASTNVQNVTDHVTAHELGHQLNVNSGSPDGHDNEMAWDRPADLCLMNAVTPPNVSVVTKFHARPTAPTRDLLCIRTHVDDLNQDICP